MEKSLLRVTGAYTIRSNLLDAHIEPEGRLRKLELTQLCSGSPSMKAVSSYSRRARQS